MNNKETQQKKMTKSDPMTHPILIKLLNKRILIQNLK